MPSFDPSPLVGSTDPYEFIPPCPIRMKNPSPCWKHALKSCAGLRTTAMIVLVSSFGIVAHAQSNDKLPTAPTTPNSPTPRSPAGSSSGQQQQQATVTSTTPISGYQPIPLPRRVGGGYEATGVPLGGSQGSAPATGNGQYDRVQRQATPGGGVYDRASAPLGGAQGRPPAATNGQYDRVQRPVSPGGGAYDRATAPLGGTQGSPRAAGNGQYGQLTLTPKPGGNYDNVGAPFGSTSKGKTPSPRRSALFEPTAKPLTPLDPGDRRGRGAKPAAPPVPPNYAATRSGVSPTQRPLPTPPSASQRPLPTPPGVQQRALPPPPVVGNPTVGGAPRYDKVPNKTPGYDKVPPKLPPKKTDKQTRGQKSLDKYKKANPPK